MSLSHCVHLTFFFNDTATTEIYTLSLHDALPISRPEHEPANVAGREQHVVPARPDERSEEHTSDLQSQSNIVCRLLIEKKTKTTHNTLSPLKPNNTLPAPANLSLH